MTAYITTKKQSVLDLAMQLYGNKLAMFELLQLNDFRGKMVQPGDNDTVVDIACALQPGIVVLYDETSPLMDKIALRLLNGAVVATCDEYTYHVFNEIYADVFA